MAWMRSAALVMILGLGGLPPGARADGYAPTSSYEVRTIEGWTARIDRALLRDAPALGEAALSLLADQLRAIARALPDEAVTRLKRVEIWVEREEGHHPCMAYHPAAPWLRDHGMNPDKARSIEIANAQNFLDWCRDQPWMVFHELAHAYHHQFVDGGFENPEVVAAFEKARDGGAYDDVLHINGRTQRHYALTNPMEYFAEGSESLFGTNDFYPFVRAELGRHDPEALALLRRLWDVEPRGGP